MKKNELLNFLRKHLGVSVGIFLSVVFWLFFSVIPLRHHRGASECGDNTLDTCIAADVCIDYPVGLPSQTDRYERYHLLFGGWSDYSAETKLYSHDSVSCHTNEIVEVQLFL